MLSIISQRGSSAFSKATAPESHWAICQKISDQRVHSVQPRFRALDKFQKGREPVCFRLKDSVGIVQSCKGCFQLVGDVGDGILEKALGAALWFCVGIQDGHQGIHRMKRPIERSCVISWDGGGEIPGQIGLSPDDGRFRTFYLSFAGLPSL